MYGELLLNSAMNQVSALEILECGVSLSLVPCFERRLKSDGKSQLFSVSVFVASFVICEVKFQFCFTIVYHTGVGMRSVFVPIFFFCLAWALPTVLDCTVRLYEYVRTRYIHTLYVSVLYCSRIYDEP